MEILHHTVGKRFAHAVTIVTAQGQGHVAAVGTQLAVHLQFCTSPFRVAITERVVVVTVFDESVVAHGFHQFIIVEGVVAIGIGVFIKGQRITFAESVVGTIGEVRTKHDIGHAVGSPFQTHAYIPVVGSCIVLVTAVAKGRGCSA